MCYRENLIFKNVVEEKHSLEDYDSWGKKYSSYSEDIEEKKSLERVLALSAWIPLSSLTSVKYDQSN